MGSDMFEAKRNETEDNKNTTPATGAEGKAAAAEGIKPAEDAKSTKAARRVEQIAIPEEGNTAGEKSNEIETLLRPQNAAEEKTDIPTTREGKLKAIEDLLRRGSNGAK